jgi:hypothetical protein
LLAVLGGHALLYVLHTPCCEGRPGRYESPWLQIPQICEFIARFGDYLRADARFDLWAYSDAGESTLVWDRHNVLYAYGEADRFAAELRALGFQRGTPSIPAPHAHHYRPELDVQAAAFLAEWSWTYSPLLPEDEP